MGQAVKPKGPMCLRTGMCCESVMLTLSPRALREAFRNWRDDVKGTKRISDIWMLYPMLAPYCRGVYEGRGPSGAPTRVYVYRCWNFRANIDGGECKVYEDRPTMCSGYPGYPDGETVKMNAPPVVMEGAWFKGCGYRPDGSGVDAMEVAAGLKPVPEDER